MPRARKKPLVPPQGWSICQRKVGAHAAYFHEPSGATLYLVSGFDFEMCKCAVEWFQWRIRLRGGERKDFLVEYNRTDPPFRGALLLIG